MGDRQWPDPQGWEALTQQVGEADARRSDLDRALELLGKALAGGFTLDNDWEYEAVKTVIAALAVAERERDQAREALRRIIPLTKAHQPERFDDVARQIHDIARAALAGGPQT